MAISLIPLAAREKVSFPKLALKDVPAKIDTGADMSAIWATNVAVHDGKLHFTLFGKGYKHYTGEVIEVSEFGRTEVRNSFGVLEERFKVRLSMVLRGERFTTYFTLADRSRNRVPILIGRRTVQKRFVVDVSLKSPVKESGPRNVLVLESVPSRDISAFFTAVNEQCGAKLNAEYIGYDELILELSGGEMRILNQNHQDMLEDRDLVYFKTYFKRAEVAAAISEQLEKAGIKFMDREVATYHAYSKLTQYARLNRAGLPIPHTVFVSSKYLTNHFDYLVDQLGLPFVLKDGFSDRGENNHLIKSKAQFAEVAVTFKAERLQPLCQRYIKSEFDYRLLVFDKKVPFGIKRHQTSTETHLHNTSKGAKAEFLKPNLLDAKLVNMAKKAAAIMNRQVAGVDIMQGTGAGEWYILEVNNAPQIGTGTFLDEKVEAFAKFLTEYDR